MKNLIMLISLLFYAFTSNAQHKRWSVGIDYVRLSYHKEFRENADLLQDHVDKDQERKRKTTPQSNTLWVSYNHPKHWSVMLKINNKYSQNTHYEIKANIPPRENILLDRRASYWDYLVGYNFAPLLFNKNQYLKDKLSIISHVGLRHFFSRYPFGTINVNMYPEPLGYHQYYEVSSWVPKSFWTFRPVTQLMVKYAPIPRVFVAGSVAWACTAPKSNPVFYHLSIGAQF